MTAPLSQRDLEERIKDETQKILERFDQRLARIERLLGSPTRRWWARSAVR